MSETKRRLEHAVPFAMEPVVYDFAINERGTEAALARGDGALMPADYYTLAVPPLLRDGIAPALARAPRRAGPLQPPPAAPTPEFSGMVRAAVRPPAAARPGARQPARRRAWTALLRSYGFDRVQHEQIQADLRGGPDRPGAEPSAGRAAASKTPRPDDVFDATRGLPRALSRDRHGRAGARAPWRWSRWRAAWAAAGPRARAW